MSRTDVSHPRRPEFERFLYASVGEDRNGYGVTVLSTLARLGLDPWKEADELAKLGRDAAHARLGQQLSRFRDVPALGRDYESVARDLALLLPEIPPLRSVAWVGSSVAKGQLVSSRSIWAIFVILLILVQMMFAGTPGPGE